MLLLQTSAGERHIGVSAVLSGAVPAGGARRAAPLPGAQRTRRHPVQRHAGARR